MSDDRAAFARLNDARQYADEIRQMASRPDGEALNGRDFLAIRYCLVIVGETLDRVSDAVLAVEPAIPWRRIVALRHRLVHGYWLIDHDIISEIAHNETGPLIAALDRLIAGIK